MQADRLFRPSPGSPEAVADGMFLLRSLVESRALLPDVEAVIRAAPFRSLETPGGRRMSVEMTNCGPLGWLSDRRGYRYDAIDPLSGRAWPAMPASLRETASSAAGICGYRGFEPDVCLINRYAPGARLGSHQDRDEADYDQPIVSVSMGLPAVFLIYGARRSGRARQLALADGDVLVFGGGSRLTYHAVKPVEDGNHPVTGRCRINLTFRRAR